MSFLTDALKEIAPGVATALGGPLAGVAVQFLSNKLLGSDSGTQEQVVAAINASSPDALSKLKLDDDFKVQMATIALETQKVQAQANLSQLDINKADAASGNWFAQDWEPLAAYVCIFGMAINFIVSPIVTFFGGHAPVLDLSEMMPVLLGMLGMGTLKTSRHLKRSE